MLTQARLKELLHYDPETGVFTWRADRRGHRNIRAGDVAGHKTPKGYVVIGIGGKVYKAHRLAWLYLHGAWPAEDIDHRFGVSAGNGVGNLREATHAQNAHNQHRAQRNNRSGLLGASWYGRDGTWRAKIVVGGKQKHLGYFATPEAAHEFYLLAKAMLHPFSSLAGSAS